MAARANPAGSAARRSSGPNNLASGRRCTVGAEIVLKSQNVCQPVSGPAVLPHLVGQGVWQGQSALSSSKDRDRAGVNGQAA